VVGVDEDVGVVVGEDVAVVVPVVVGLVCSQSLNVPSRNDPIA
jgi:hypothetical protein